MTKRQQQQRRQGNTTAQNPPSSTAPAALAIRLSPRQQRDTQQSNLAIAGSPRVLIEDRPITSLNEETEEDAFFNTLEEIIVLQGSPTPPAASPIAPVSHRSSETHLVGTESAVTASVVAPRAKRMRADTVPDYVALAGLKRRK